MTTEVLTLEQVTEASGETKEDFVKGVLADLTERFGYTTVLASLSHVAEKETDRVLEQERNRVKAGRLATIRRDLAAMVTVLKGEL